MKNTATFYNGKNEVIVTSNHFETIRSWANTGIPKNAVKSGNRIYVAASTLQRISTID